MISIKYTYKISSKEEKEKENTAHDYCLPFPLQKQNKKWSTIRMKWLEKERECLL